MTRYLLNKISMYKTVKTVCNEFQSVWNGVPAFADTYNMFVAKLDQLGELGLKQSKAITGKASTKAKTRKAAVVKAMVLVNALKAFAKVSSNDTLRDEINFSRSSLIYGRYKHAENNLITILENARAYETELADFGIDPTDITELETLIDAFIAELEAPRVAVISRKFYTNKMKTVMRELDDLLNKQLDQLAGVLLEDSPEFHQKYINARVIVDRKGRSPDDTGESPPGDTML